MKRLFAPFLSIVLTIGFLVGCSSTKSAEETALKNQQFDELKELVADRSFVFSAESAYPMQSYAVLQVNNALFRNTGNSAGRIDLAGNGDFIKVIGDTVLGKLPYFGEVRVVSSLDPNDSGINFNGTPDAYEVIENQKKQTLRLKFDIKQKSERFTVIMELFPNKRSTVFINCQNRTPMRFDGKVKAIKNVTP